MSFTNQTVANIGLYYICYRLSRLGWNVMPTSRNARGVDVLAYSQDASQTLTVQVKSLSGRSPVPLGGSLNHLFANYLVICRYIDRERPECFVLTPEEVIGLAHRGVKNEKVSFWLQPKQYEGDAFRERWDRIGWGNKDMSLDVLPAQKALAKVAAAEFRRTTRDFRLALQCRLAEAGRKGLNFIDVNAGELHREVGGYPGANHRMPVCCDALRKSMLPGDEIVSSPPKGKGASFTVRFRIPHG